MSGVKGKSGIYKHKQSQGFRKGNKLQKLKKNFPDFRGSKNPFYGKHHTQETKDKHSEYMKGKLAGEKHPRWLGGVSSRFWAEQVRVKAYYKCERCGYDDDIRILQAHHKISKAIEPGLKNDINNGECLCPNCHAIKTLEDKTLKKLKSELTKKQWRTKNNQHSQLSVSDSSRTDTLPPSSPYKVNWLQDAT